MTLGRRIFTGPPMPVGVDRCIVQEHAIREGAPCGSRLATGRGGMFVFGTTPNALPLDAICRAAEISLAPHLDEPVPTLLQARDLYLS